MQKRLKRLSPKRQRLIFVSAAVIAVSAGVLLVLNTFQDNIVFFYTPSDIAVKTPAPGATFRLGGLVEAGSVKRQHEVLHFTVTDGKAKLPVDYSGIVPNLFREGQGVVAEGRLTPEGSFSATRILAKHDERYMPKEVAEKLKASGYWKPEAPDAP